MPELPDLEVIRERLADRILDLEIASVDVLRPIVVRDLTGDGPDCAVGRRSVSAVNRRGKFLLVGLDDGAGIVINPMLAGRIRLGAPLLRDRKRDAFVIRFDNGTELRYHDAADMGKVYITRDLAAVPALTELGPDAYDPALSTEHFLLRIRRHRGEIKGILANQGFIAGIGNAYADEICWSARLYPFRRRSTLGQEELVRLFDAIRTVLSDAIDVLRSRMPETLDVEIRDFLKVHGKAGQPCPRCAAAVSEVKRERRITNFCRTCQPGLMVSR